MTELHQSNYGRIRDRINKFYPQEGNKPPTQIQLVKSGRPRGWNWKVDVSGPSGQAKTEYNSLEKVRKENNSRKMARTVLSKGEDPQLVACLEHIKNDLLKDFEEYREELKAGATQSQGKIVSRRESKLK